MSSLRRKRDKTPKPKITRAVDVTPPPEQRQEDLWNEHTDRITAEIKRLYEERLKPLEERYCYDQFNRTDIEDELNQRQPMVTFLGPFSTGKSSFINYLIQNEKALATGPQPVTDKFQVLSYGDRFQTITGRVLLADPKLPFRSLEPLGDTFTERICGVTAPHAILRSCTLVDTPGIMEAAGDTRGRPYNYTKACKWFVDHSDLVFIVFDPTKLDLGSELKSLFSVILRGNEPKIRIVMNKADMVSPTELLRVYGSLFWSLSNTISSPEPPRIYVSSFWDRPYAEDTDHDLFDEEKEELLKEILEVVPLSAIDNRVTKMIKRCNSVLGFCLIASAYKEKTDVLVGKDKAKKQFWKQYPSMVKETATRCKVNETIFPTYESVKDILTEIDMEDIPEISKLEKKGWLELMKVTIKEDLPKLLQEPVKQYAISDPRARRNSGESALTYNESLHRGTMSNYNAQSNYRPTNSFSPAFNNTRGNTGVYNGSIYNRSIGGAPGRGASQYQNGAGFYSQNNHNNSVFMDGPQADQLSTADTVSMQNIIAQQQQQLQQQQQDQEQLMSTMMKMMQEMNAE